MSRFRATRRHSSTATDQAIDIPTFSPPMLLWSVDRKVSTLSEANPLFGSLDGIPDDEDRDRGLAENLLGGASHKHT